MHSDDYFYKEAHRSYLYSHEGSAACLYASLEFWNTNKCTVFPSQAVTALMEAPPLL